MNVRDRSVDVHVLKLHSDVTEASSVDLGVRGGGDRRRRGSGGGEGTTAGARRHGRDPVNRSGDGNRSIRQHKHDEQGDT
jgi:hypothetical protein